MERRLAIFLLSLSAMIGCKENHQSESTNHAISQNQIRQTVELRAPVIVTFRPPEPNYPKGLKVKRFQGDIKLVIHLDKSGKIISIQKESGPDEFMQTAETYARQFQFDVDQSLFSQVQSVPYRLTIKFRLPAK